MAQVHQPSHPQETLGQGHFLGKIDLPVPFRHLGCVRQGHLAQNSGGPGGLGGLQDAGMGGKGRGVRPPGNFGAAGAAPASQPQSSRAGIRLQARTFECMPNSM